MKIFVTGGSGFIGNHTVRRLSELGHEVAASSAPRENDFGLMSRTPVIFGYSLKKIAKEAYSYNDLLVHLAANNETQSDDRKAMFDANFQTPKDMFQRFADAGCKRFVYASSTAVYGNSPAPYYEDKTPLNPLTPYAESKADFEAWAKGFSKERGVAVVGLRFCNVYGPGESHKGKRASMVRQLITQKSLDHKPQLFWDGGQSRDWCYVKDAVSATVLAGSFDGCEVFNIACGRSWTFHEILETINRFQPGRYAVKYVPNPFPETYQNHVECDIDKATKLLGYNPKFDLALGVHEYLRHWD